MTRRVAILMVLLSGASHAQSVAPPVAEPLPAFPLPEYTPAGAGAGPGMLAAPELETLPRSPNRRELPVTNEPGIWAADETRASPRTPPTIAGVELLVPDTDAGEFETRVCADEMERLLRSEGQVSAIMELRLDDRRCVAIRLEVYCWESYLESTQAPERRAALTLALEQTRPYLQYVCRNTRVPKPDADRVFNAVRRAWQLTAAQRERDTTRRRRR